MTTHRTHRVHFKVTVKSRVFSPNMSRTSRESVHAGTTVECRILKATVCTINGRLVETFDMVNGVGCIYTRVPYACVQFLD